MQLRPADGAHLAVDPGRARWDRAHLHRFTLADGTQIGRPDWEGDDDWDEEPPLTDGRRLGLGRLRGGEQFPYTFDLGDDWTHLCTVAPARIDPLQAVGITPEHTPALLGVGRDPRSARPRVQRRRRRHRPRA